MENLTLDDAPQAQGGQLGGAQMQMPGPGMAMPPPPNQQLPPQMFTTAAQLLDMTDSKTYISPLRFGFRALKPAGYNLPMAGYHECSIGMGKLRDAMLML